MWTLSFLTCFVCDGVFSTYFPDGVLQETLQHAVNPKTLRYIDFKIALKSYASICLVCKKFNDAIKKVKITYQEKDLKTKRKMLVTKPMGAYLHYLAELSKHKNRMINFYGKKYQSLQKVESERKTIYSYFFHSLAGVSPKLFCFISYYSCRMEPLIKDQTREYSNPRQITSLEPNGHSHGTCIAYNLSCIKKLLYNLHDPNRSAPMKSQFNSWHSPLEAALMNIHCPVELVELLLDCGASLENIDGLGNNALTRIKRHLCSMKGYYSDRQLAIVQQKLAVIKNRTLKQKPLNCVIQ